MDDGVHQLSVFTRGNHHGRSIAWDHVENAEFVTVPVRENHGPTIAQSTLKRGGLDDTNPPGAFEGPVNGEDEVRKNVLSEHQCK
jgi:hypothetical protein